MTRITIAEAFSEFATAMVGEHDVAGTLSDILTNCAQVLEFDACDLLVNDGDNGMQLLGATSHSAEELELHQAQIYEGPCVESGLSGATVVAVGEDAVCARWPYFGPRMIEAGFHSVLSVPMAWHDRPFVALNLFSSSDTEPTEESVRLAQTFADLATILAPHIDELTLNEARDRIRAALESRTVVEQAKGVISQRHGLDMATAYDRLLASAAERGLTLSALAVEVIEDAQRR
ncbi:MAG: GAF and ANTAR domain-containing protein [Actinomycetota bacterium]|nr:GAF and ANTAR domain-containing protein [Actinomycetota bacterium]